MKIHKKEINEQIWVVEDADKAIERRSEVGGSDEGGSSVGVHPGGRGPMSAVEIAGLIITVTFC